MNGVHWLSVFDIRIQFYGELLEEIPCDGLENVYGQPQTIEQRNTMIWKSNSFFVHCFCQTKITSTVRFLGRTTKKLNGKVIYYKERPLIFRYPSEVFLNNKKHSTLHRSLTLSRLRWSHLIFNRPELLF